MFNEELLRQIKIAVRNHAYPHVEDNRRVVCIFYRLFKEGKFDLAEVEGTINELPPEFTEDTTLELYQFAFVFSVLAEC
jgi:hypothetical protein